MATQIWVNFHSGYGLMPDSTKPLPEPKLTHHWRVPAAIQLWAVTREVLRISVCIRSLKIILLKLLPHLPGANETIHWWVSVNTEKVAMLIPQSHRPNRHETDLKPTKIIKFGERSVYSRYWFGFVGLVSVYVWADKFVGERSFKHVWKISTRQIVGCLSVICRCGVGFVGERSGTYRS